MYGHFDVCSVEKSPMFNEIFEIYKEDKNLQDFFNTGTSQNEKDLNNMNSKLRNVQNTSIVKMSKFENNKISTIKSK